MEEVKSEKVPQNLCNPHVNTEEVQSRKLRKKFVHKLDKYGWRRPRSDGQEGYEYKVVVCPCGHGPNIDEPAEGVKSHDVWMREEEITPKWIYEQVKGESLDITYAVEAETPDGLVVVVLNEDAPQRRLPINYLVNDWIGDDSETYFGPCIVLSRTLVERVFKDTKNGDCNVM